MIAKDATFLISLATEEFIKRLSEAGQRVAEREKRSTVQHKDIGAVLCESTTFVFTDLTLMGLQLLLYGEGTSLYSSKVC
jgi:Histone-like transcription factor (CBF/NF-Y) and archaeal histone